jgi:hypothetical protein
VEANTVAVTGDPTVEETSLQLVLPDIPRVPADPRPTALADAELLFEILANKMAERRAKIKSALCEMGHLLIDAQATLRGKWLKFLDDPRVGLNEREAQRIMRLARQADCEVLANFGISKATILLEKLRTPEDRQTFINDHGDIAQIPERELRQMLKPTPAKKPAVVVPATTALESLPPELGQLRERVLEMTASEVAWIPIKCNFVGKDFRSLPEWGKFLVLGMFIATPSFLRAAQYAGPLQMAMEVGSEPAIDAALQRMIHDAREWLLADTEGTENVVNWWKSRTRTPGAAKP